MINELCVAAHQNAVEKGFYEVEPSVCERLCLVHEEVSEAVKADRNENYSKYSPVDIAEIPNSTNGIKVEFPTFIKDTFEDELADICIRVFDLAGHLGIDLEAHIKAKMRYNSMRPHKHGKKY